MDAMAGCFGSFLHHESSERCAASESGYGSEKYRRGKFRTLPEPRNFCRKVAYKNFLSSLALITFREIPLKDTSASSQVSYQIDADESPSSTLGPSGDRKALLLHLLWEVVAVQRESGGHNGNANDGRDGEEQSEERGQAAVLKVRW